MDVQGRYKLKYKWQKGENKTQYYYEARVNGVYLCVFANKDNPNIYMGYCNDICIGDKTFNDAQRKQQKLPKDCSTALLYRTRTLTSSDANYMMHKVEWCFDHNLTEISR